MQYFIYFGEPDCNYQNLEALISEANKSVICSWYALIYHSRTIQFCNVFHFFEVADDASDTRIFYCILCSVIFFFGNIFITFIILIDPVITPLGYEVFIVIIVYFPKDFVFVTIQNFFYHSMV